MLLILFLFTIHVTSQADSSSQRYSLLNLTQVGGGVFPPVSAIIDPNLVQYDIVGRQVLRMVRPFCRWKDIYLDWCCSSGACPNATNNAAVNNPYAYCIISETWPQADLVGWLNNTVFQETCVECWFTYNYYCS